MPRFADFLIGVEAEMNKVSWPSRTELVRASMVVLFTIFLLATVLFAFDLLWSAIFAWLEIKGGAGTSGAG
jgi:preprotein translocase subunit SecE